MQQVPFLTIPALFAETLRKYGDEKALSFTDEKAMTFNQVNDYINALIASLEKAGIRKGDKVAILSKNMPNWGISYYALAFMGAVAVPLLPDFMPKEISNVLEHAEVKAIFVSKDLEPKLKEISYQGLEFVVGMEDFSFTSDASDRIHFDISEKPQKKYVVDEEDLLAIIYTSGTTGTSKGVMLSHKNISFTTIKAHKIQPVTPNDRLLSVLPLSHTYENTLGLILPLFGGSCVYYLKSAPTPNLLLPALEKVRPTVMLTVPLFIEKIYKKRIVKTFQKNGFIKAVYRIPPFRKLLNRLAGKKLMKTFGGELKFYGIGGSKLNPVVESFLREARFPYAIGYGLTETSPLLAGSGPSNTRLESTGPALEGIELKIHDPDPQSGEGEIWAKGPNVMRGYYKEPMLTKEVLTEDGWFKTGDRGIFDDEGNLYIKGRIKNMIVGSSGENIYPEEIESVINRFTYVVESLVIEKKGRLVAMVHMNLEELEEQYKYMKEELTNFVEKKKEDLIRELHAYVNAHVNKFSRIHQIEYMAVPFKKTATQKIKRFLYT